MKGENTKLLNIQHYTLNTMKDRYTKEERMRWVIEHKPFGVRFMPEAYSGCLPYVVVKCVGIENGCFKVEPYKPEVYHSNSYKWCRNRADELNREYGFKQY